MKYNSFYREYRERIGSWWNEYAQDLMLHQELAIIGK